MSLRVDPTSALAGCVHRTVFERHRDQILRGNIGQVMSGASRPPDPELLGFLQVGLLFVCLCWFLNVLISNEAISRTGPETDAWQFYLLPHTRHSWETMTSFSAGHIRLTPTQPVGSGWSQRGSNPRPPHRESRALPATYENFIAPQFSKRLHKDGAVFGSASL